MGIHLLLKVEEVVGLVNEEDLQSRAAQVVASQVDLSDLSQRPFEIMAYTLQTEIVNQYSVNTDGLSFSIHVFLPSHLPLSPGCCHRSRCVVW